MTNNYLSKSSLLEKDEEEWSHGSRLGTYISEKQGVSTKQHGTQEATQ